MMRVCSNTYIWTTELEVTTATRPPSEAHMATGWPFNSHSAMTLPVPGSQTRNLSSQPTDTVPLGQGYTPETCARGASSSTRVSSRRCFEPYLAGVRDTGGGVDSEGFGDAVCPLQDHTVIATSHVARGPGHDSKRGDRGTVTEHLFEGTEFGKRLRTNSAMHKGVTETLRAGAAGFEGSR